MLPCFYFVARPQLDAPEFLSRNAINTRAMQLHVD